MEKGGSSEIFVNTSSSYNINDIYSIIKKHIYIYSHIHIHKLLDKRKQIFIHMDIHRYRYIDTIYVSAMYACYIYICIHIDMHTCPNIY